MKLRGFSTGLAACVLAVAVALPATVAGAAPQHQRSQFHSHTTGSWTPPAAAGKVGTVTPPGTFTVLDAHSSTTTTVVVSGPVTYKEWGVTMPSFSSVQSGDYVIVVGTTSGSTVTPTSIIIMVPRPAPTPPAAIGKVTTIGTGTFTITGLKGTVWTIDVTDGVTTYSENGVTTPPPSFNSLTTNDFVSVQGTLTGTTVSATSIRIFDPSRSTAGWGLGHRRRPGPPTMGWTPPAAAGKVGTVTPPGTFTVLDAHSSTTTTVVVSGPVTYKEWGVTMPSFSSVQSGDYVIVVGTTSGSTVTPTSIIIMVPRPAPTPPAAIGKVTTIGTGTFTITGLKGTVWTIDVTDGVTTYSENGVTTPPPSFNSLTTNDFVSVQGTLTGTTVSATSIRIFDPSLPVIGWGGPVPLVGHAPLVSHQGRHF